MGKNSLASSPAKRSKKETSPGKKANSPNKKASSPKKKGGSPHKKGKGDLLKVGLCEHVGPNVHDFMRSCWQALKAPVAGCSECGKSCLPLFKCLSCPAMGCWHVSKGVFHFREHSRLTNHWLAIEPASGCVYCAACDRFLWSHALRQIKAAEGETSSFPEEMFAPLPSHLRGHCHGLRGLWNLGSTCFMNSVLQVVLHCRPLVEHFMHSDPPHTRQTCQRGSECMCCLLDELIMATYNGETEPLTPTSLLRSLWQGSAHGLIGYEQQDAHEMLIELRHLLHTHAGGSSFNCTCIVHRLFAGVLQSTVTCGHCQAHTETLDPFLDLSLEPAATLGESFERFIQPERLPAHSYTCPTCHRNQQDATKQFLLRTPPPILTLHLKRFEHPAAAKLDLAVKFPQWLNLAPYTLHQTPSHYRLFALVGHVGSLDSGHYTAHVRHEGQWYWVDDAHIHRVPAEHVLAANAYMLFYEKI